MLQENGTCLWFRFTPHERSRAERPSRSNLVTTRTSPSRTAPQQAVDASIDRVTKERNLETNENTVSAPTVYPENIPVRRILRGSTPDRPSRYLEPELLTVAGELALASLALPPGPYPLRL